MKKTVEKKTTGRKSRTQRFIEDSMSDIPDMTATKKFDIMDVEKKMFPVRFGTTKGGKMKIFDDTTSTEGALLPNDPCYVGFRQPLPGQMTCIPPQIVKHFGSRIHFIGWQACAFLAEHNFIYKACAMPGDDALECGYEVSGKKIKSSVVDDMREMFEDKEFNLDESLRQFEFNKRVFGFAIAIPVFEEGEYDELENPNGIRYDVPLVDYMQFKGKHFLGWAIVDPYWTVPEFDKDAERNPMSRHFFQPTWWKINGRGISVHRSWCMYARNTMMANVTAPTYLWGGISIPQLCFERVYSADKCANEAQMVAMSKRLIAITGMNMKKMAANPEYAKRTMTNLEFNRDNWGVVSLGFGQDIKQLDTYISEFNQLITTQYQLFCGIVEVPAPKMMMSPLTGFANSGNYEWKVYGANLKKVQGREYSPMLKMTYRIQAACMGIDARFDVKWGEMDIPTMVEQSQMEYEEARAKKFNAEAVAVTKLAKQREREQAETSAETHKGVIERIK